MAIKYNHRISTDIDLFSPNIIGIDKMEGICTYLNEEYGEDKVDIDRVNFSREAENMAMLQIELKEHDIKLDIIQNIKFSQAPTVIDGIRLVNDLDVGALKLLAASNRGTRKDFYDLVLLTNNTPLSVYHEA